MKNTRGVISLEKSKTCGTCAHFRQYYIYSEPRRVCTPSHCGYCTYPRVKNRHEYETCDHYESGATAAYLEQKARREEDTAVREFRDEWRRERAAEQRKG